MKTEYLQEGDVILLKKGMKVYAEIPEMFVFSNRLTSKELRQHDIVVGEKYENNTDISKAVSNVIKYVIDGFDREGFVINFNTVNAFVRENIDQPEHEEFIVEEGGFVVVKTNWEGGGAAMFHDVYPDGHRVYCQRLKNGIYDPDGQEVNFYQSGGFTAMIKDIKPICKLKKSTAFN